MWTKREGTPMERKLGLYVTLGNDGSLKRTLVSISGETELEATTLNDEVILFSELIFDFYAFIVDRIRLSAAYLVTQDGDGKDTVDMRVFEFIQDTVQDLIEEFEEDDPLYGTLTRTIMEDRIPAADGSDTYPMTAVEKIISELSAVMLTQFSVNNILRDMRFHVPVDLDKKYRSLQEVEFTQISSFSNLHTPEYLFRSAADYYTFLVLHFIAAEPRVALCECCGRYFIPKTAKKTLYCDRVLKDDKTCKDLGPALKHKLQAQNKKVVEEFDRAKQRMYKRYDRALDPNKKVSKKDLSYAEYYEWLEAATEARDAYLAGKLSEKDALKVIREDFVNRDKM